MALVSFSLLCMFVSALLFSHTDAAKDKGLLQTTRFSLQCVTAQSWRKRKVKDYQERVSRPASKYVPQKSLPYLFMLTNPMYLHLTTRGIPGVACIKAIRTKMNPKARTLSQVLVFKSSQKWSYDYEYVDYTPIWKNNKKVRGFTSFN
ncbi:uncharacterized protein LOC119165678 isoform X2 [Rhipicephalus microplus]|uniref:uncharacterized protein LOC119165678 isoform X2 n=1 Tax=Rhipicephalus microplus TaxID=6941 RepID=UPI003F6A9FD1